MNTTGNGRRMGGLSRRRYREWSGTLLLVQLLALAVVPLLHVDAPSLAADHVELPGSHPAGHDEAACHVCRAADARFAPAAAAAPGARAAVASACSAAEPGWRRAPCSLYPPVAPRGPPAA